MPSHELAIALRNAYLSMHRRTNAALKSSEATVEQFVVLAALADFDATTQRELVERTSSDPNTLRAMLVLLERRGLVRRGPHPTDGRARSVSLTRSGRATLKRLWRDSGGVREEIDKEFSPSEQTAFSKMLRRMNVVMNDDSIEASSDVRSSKRPSKSSANSMNGKG